MTRWRRRGNTGGPTWWGWNHSCADFGKLIRGTLLILSLGYWLSEPEATAAPLSRR